MIAISTTTDSTSMANAVHVLVQLLRIGSYCEIRQRWTTR